MMANAHGWICTDAIGGMHQEHYDNKKVALDEARSLPIAIKKRQIIFNLAF